MNILVYRIGELGDTVIALPALWAVRQAFPQAALTLLTAEDPGAGNVAARSVLPLHGLMDDYLGYRRAGCGSPGALLRLWRILRGRRFDVLVYLAPRLRPARSVRRDLLFFRLCGIRRVLAHRGFEPLPPRMPDRPLPFTEHEADHLLRRLGLSGVPVPPPGHGTMSLALTQRERQDADDWLCTRVPRYCRGMNLVGIGPGSKWPSKVWPAERFLELGSRLVRKLELYPIVFGGPQDAALAERLIAGWGCGVSAAGTMGVRPAAALLARCCLYVGNDTGTMHLAAAAGTRCVGIFAAQDWPGRWHPYGTGHVVLRRSPPCEGCLLSLCTREGMRCLNEISTADVVRACRAVLGLLASEVG